MHGRKLAQVDITLISAEHVKQKREKLLKYGEMDKARKVNVKKIGLGARGLRIHLVHEDGWQWWKELIEGMSPITDENGTYSYRFLQPGEDAFKHFVVHIPDQWLTDREAAPRIFKDEVMTQDPTFEEFEWECRWLGTKTDGSRPVAVMRMSIPADRAEWLLTYNEEAPGSLLYGIESHYLFPDDPDSRKRRPPTAGMGAEGRGGIRPPPPSGSREEEETEEEEDELAGGGDDLELIDLNESLLNDEELDDKDKKKEN